MDLILIAGGSFSAGIIALLIKQRVFMRLKTAEHIKPELIKRQVRLEGFVLSVNDSDNFRFYHTPTINLPFLRLAHVAYWRIKLFGFSFRDRKIFVRNYVQDSKNISGSGCLLSRKEITNSTIHVRLSGIDAPESAYFGMPKQEFNEESKSWLRSQLIHQRIIIQLHRRDQYGRLVCSVYKPKLSFPYSLIFLPPPTSSNDPTRLPLGFRMTHYNISLEMIKAGWAVVYKSAGAEYNGILKQLENAEALARKSRTGMWKNGTKSFTSPSEHKKKYLK